MNYTTEIQNDLYEIALEAMPSFSYLSLTAHKQEDRERFKALAQLTEEVLKRASNTLILAV